MSKILLHQRHRNASGSNRLPISEQGGDQLCQGVRQGGVALAGQVHEISGIELRPRLVGVQEVTARLLRHPLEVGGELPGLLHAAVAHGAHLVRHRGGEDAFPNDGRRNDEDVGLSAGAPALRGLGRSGTRRRIPRLMAKAFMPKRSLLSLVPSMTISRLTGSWLVRQGQR